jgi:hypothetical protein
METSCLIKVFSLIYFLHLTHSRPSQTEVKNEWSYTATPRMPSWHGQGQLYVYICTLHMMTNYDYLLISMHKNYTAVYVCAFVGY